MPTCAGRRLVPEVARSDWFKRLDIQWDNTTILPYARLADEIRCEGATEADFSAMDFTAADLHATTMWRVSFVASALPRANLRETAISEGDLTRANLQSADLTGAKLWTVVLADADLRGAVLRGAQLTVVDLSRADLRGTDLTDVEIRWGCNWSGARMDASTRPSLQTVILPVAAA